ncbi:SGNH/GDSL hydrolase family protein [Streptomyces radicis]|uniref:SGNH/GDSL hydrolase family protein n=1 Tax=Streptomyces radicis TaxID=1750517 RepID=A0A3A9VXX2_9ACTN|nr:SGNH/GDSL hydrolase family protein [Streptomyces radicis]RKN05818.1 SGNH/GDSL hydrolase family protein [Streptomyces radicis]RKN17627.1 SGNH/GDSL hydrolase family protein [Streptomyces radicis]
MKLRRSLALAATAAVAIGVSALGPASATAQEAAAVDYVALGDSYSSGVGAGSYDEASGDCRRSTVAYPELWAAANAPTSFAFPACSGATTADVLDSQLGSLDAATTLVSISIGGNDAGFADVMTTCVLQGTDACLSAVGTATSFIDAELPGRLDTVYGAISGGAPNAQVVVLGYPRIYQLDGDCAFGISEESRAAINSAADALHDVTSAAAAGHGFAYGDVRPAFTGHEICSGDEWLNSTTLPVVDSYHPNAAGQSGGYYAVMESLA